VASRDDPAAEASGMYHTAEGMAPQQYRPHRGLGESPGAQSQKYTSQFVVGSSGGKAAEEETDPHRIAQRQKQIDYGKNTLGYQRYTEEIPKHLRRKIRHTILKHPDTPDVKQICSKRSFDGQVKKWRRELHHWDPEEDDALEPIMTNQLPSPGEPAVVPEPSPFFSPKKQKTAEGHVMQQRAVPPRQCGHAAQDSSAADDTVSDAPSRKQLSTGSKRTYQDMDADTASCVEPSSRPAALPAGVYAERSPTKQTDTAQAGNLDADDDFGPEFEFH